MFISLDEDKEERNIISQNSGSSLEMSLFPSSIGADSVPGQMKGWSLMPPWRKNRIQKSQLRMWVCLKMIHKASDLICVQITTTSSSHLRTTVLPSDKEKFLFNFPEHHFIYALKAHISPTLLFVMSLIYHFAQPYLAIRSTLNCSLPILNSRETDVKNSLEKHPLGKEYCWIQNDRIPCLAELNTEYI